MATRRAPEKQEEQVRPDHYDVHPAGIECIEVVQHFNFNIGNAIKYLWRLGLKQGNDPITELRKAKTYIDFEIARIQNELDAAKQIERRREGKEGGPIIPD
jgi:hypothetical protein